jgi:hypothetical protein
MLDTNSKPRVRIAAGSSMLNVRSEKSTQFQSTFEVPLNEFGDPTDRIVKLLNLGFSEAEVFEDIHHHCNSQMKSTRVMMDLADFIAQIHRMDVDALGQIPPEFVKPQTAYNERRKQEHELGIRKRKVKQ